jgi:5,10-methylenetetrahydrofolate reductase
MPAPARAAPNDSVNCPARSRTRNRKSGGAVAEIHQEVADLLHSPRPVRVGGHAEDVHVTGADFHHEEAIQALERHRAVNVEEIDG